MLATPQLTVFCAMSDKPANLRRRAEDIAPRLSDLKLGNRKESQLETSCSWPSEVETDRKQQIVSRGDAPTPVMHVLGRCSSLRIRFAEVRHHLWPITVGRDVITQRSAAPMSSPPPPGVYVPAVLFFTEDEEFDVASIKTHIIRLAKVRIASHCHSHGAYLNLADLPSLRAA